MHTDSGHVSIRIESPSSRAWAVRLHLLPQQRLRSTAVDGSALDSSGLLLDSSDEYFPLSGAGTSLPAGAGSVAELRLAPGSHARTVEVTLDSALLV